MYISSDTNVWIDFHEIDHLDHPFLLGYQYYISRDTFREEFLKSAPMRDELIKNGLNLTDSTDEEFINAIGYQSQYPALSHYDALALSIAKNRGWVLLTGDMPLRKAACKEGVECHGIIWIYDQLKATAKISAEEYSSAICDMIEAVKHGHCRLPLVELENRLS